MGNLRRFFEENVSYFVTTATFERRPIFDEKKLCRILLVTIEYYKTVFDFSVYGYCVMPDHLHIILKPTGSFNLSYIMKMIKGGFARKINRLKNDSGSVWQKRFYDEAIRDEKQLLNQLEYMHQNPVKAGIVPSPEQYSFSSYCQYHRRSSREDAILQIDPFA